MKAFEYQHISEINPDSRLLGKQGLRLKVREETVRQHDILHPKSVVKAKS